MLATSDNQGTAEKFLEFMLSPVAQQYFASSTFEYPLVEGVRTQRELVPITQIKNPSLPVADLADLKGTQELLRDTGILP